MHRVSAAALVTARLILKEYWLEVRPPETLPSGSINNLRNTAAHIAIVIDLATNVFKVAELRPELGHWFMRLQKKNADAAGLSNYLSKVIDTFAEIPQYQPGEARVVVDGRPVAVGPAPPQRIELTKAALKAVQLLTYYYIVKPYSRDFAPADEIRLAQLAETGLGLYMAREVETLARRTLERMKNNQATGKEIRASFREIGVLLQYLPTYQDRREERMLLT